MKSYVCVSLLACSLGGCATSSLMPSMTPAQSQVAEFVMAGPINADAPELSVQWSYGLKFTIDPSSIEKITFSCPPIPGTEFVYARDQIVVSSGRVAYMNGPVLPITKETTPWMLDNSKTSAVCRAQISRAGVPDAQIQAPVNFPPDVKAATLAQMKMAQEFNSRSKAK